MSQTNSNQRAAYHDAAQSMMFFQVMETDGSSGRKEIAGGGRRPHLGGLYMSYVSLKNV